MRAITMIMMVTALAAPAAAEVAAPCGPVGRIVAGLAASHGEAIVARALLPDGRLLLFLASPRTGTWTEVEATPDGTACGVKAGKGWESGDVPC